MPEPSVEAGSPNEARAVTWLAAERRDASPSDLQWRDRSGIRPDSPHALDGLFKERA